MPIGNPDKNNLEKIRKLGYCIRDNVDLLGINICSKMNNSEDIFNKIHQKLIGISSFWERFKLSLCGRIVIAKTFLLSQLNYVGCFLNPPPHTLRLIQDLIDGFVTKNLNIAVSRLYKPPEAGGLGLFNLEQFLTAQKVTWVIRAEQLTIDNWRASLFNLAPDNDIMLLRSSDVEDKTSILFNLADSYEKFYNSFTKKDCNLKKAYIFENSNLTVGPDDRLIDASFFGAANYTVNKVAIRKLTVENCFIGGQFKNVNTFSADGIFLSHARWLELYCAVWKALSKCNLSVNDKGQSISDFFLRYKKGSKKIRSILTGKNVGVTTLRTVNTFAAITGTVLPTTDELKCCLKLWSFQCFSNDFREFLFLERNNTLKIN